MRGKIFLIVFLLVVMLAVGVVMSLEFFRIKQVSVEGCSQRDPVMVADLAAIPYDESIFKLNLRSIRSAIEKSPYFDVVSIDILLPDRVNIVVAEHAECAVMQFAGSVIAMDEQGYIVEIRSGLGGLNVPIVTGLTPSSFEVGKVLAMPEGEEASLDALCVVLKTLKAQNAAYMISQIEMDNPSDIHLITVDGFTVELGSFEDMDMKLRWLRATLPVVASEGYTSGIINVSTGDSAAFSPAQDVVIPLSDVVPPTDNEPDQDQPGETTPATGEPEPGEPQPDETPSTTEPSTPTPSPQGEPTTTPT